MHVVPPEHRNGSVGEVLRARDCGDGGKSARQPSRRTVKLGSCGLGRSLKLADFLVTSLDVAVRSKESQKFLACGLRRGSWCAVNLVLSRWESRLQAEEPAEAGIPTDPLRFDVALVPGRRWRTTRFPCDRVQENGLSTVRGSRLP